MFPEHVERSFLDPEYSFDEYFQLGSRRKVGPIKNQLASPNTSNWVREETFAQLRMGLRRNQIQQWLKERCRKPVLGVWVGGCGGGGGEGGVRRAGGGGGARSCQAPKLRGFNLKQAVTYLCGSRVHPTEVSASHSTALCYLFSSAKKKTLIIPQGSVLLWSCRARKIMNT